MANHVVVGTLCAVTLGLSACTPETDPLYSASPAVQITAAQEANWQSAYGWGDHSKAGYLKAEADPLFSASPAAAITSSAVGQWNTAFGWGDHTAAGYLKTEADPVFSASAAASISAESIGNWSQAHAWGDHATAGYLKLEADPTFTASPAAGINANHVSNWNTSFGWGNHATAGYLTTEHDPKIGALTQNAVARWNGTSLVPGVLTDTGSGVGIGTTTPAGEVEVFSTPVNPAALDQSQTNVAYGTGSSDQWQSFTAGASGQLTRIDLGVSSPVAPQSSAGTITIYAGEGTGGAVLSTTAVTFVPSGFNSLQSFAISGGPVLTAGQIYTYRFKVPSITVGWVWGQDGAYAGGHCSFNANCDFVFKTYIAPAATPESTLKVQAATVSIGGLFHLAPKSAAPATATEGDIYFDATTHRPAYFNGTSWVSL